MALTFSPPALSLIPLSATPAPAGRAAHDDIHKNLLAAALERRTRLARIPATHP